MSQNLLRFIIRHKSSTGGNMVRCRGVAWGLDGVRTRGRKVVAPMRRRLNLEGFGGMLPQKMFKFRVSEMPFPAFSTLFSVNKYARKSSSQLFVLPIPSVVCKVECLREKKGQWRHQIMEQPKAKENTNAKIPIYLIIKNALSKDFFFLISAVHVRTACVGIWTLRSWGKSAEIPYGWRVTTLGTRLI